MAPSRFVAALTLLIVSSGCADVQSDKNPIYNSDNLASVGRGSIGGLFSVAVAGPSGERCIFYTAGSSTPLIVRSGEIRIVPVRHFRADNPRCPTRSYRGARYVILDSQPLQHEGRYLIVWDGRECWFLLPTTDQEAHCMP